MKIIELMFRYNVSANVLERRGTCDVFIDHENEPSITWEDTRYGLECRVSALGDYLTLLGEPFTMSRTNHLGGVSKEGIVRQSNDDEAGEL
jgi:hypothetical protein